MLLMSAELGVRRDKVQICFQNLGKAFPFSGSSL